MKNLKKRIVIKLQVEGTHCWPNCNIEEVKFLSNIHRHIFFIEMHKEVQHNDRDIEIIMFKRKVINYLNSFGGNFQSSSCEDIAEDLLLKFEAQYVKVLEDNENGAIVKK
jgi:hypothetical protein